MPYKVQKVKGQKKFAIINAITHKVVGHSTTAKKAYASIAHREDAEHLSTNRKGHQSRRMRA